METPTEDESMSQKQIEEVGVVAMVIWSSDNT